ncbi:hypothetical protein T4C_12046 [Trichinella pseudospiralis]|uniref:Uncharacterized protein n=1 Tax=Trichinella pseudospiralis TaxID=6337 RepID=A0A0V1GK23_TRIPS|nr:hypothetical protein T4C_12046 [Trichinella pseudospiralis]
MLTKSVLLSWHRRSMRPKGDFCTRHNVVRC